MELPDPDERVKAAVNGAMEWLIYINYMAYVLSGS